MKKNQYVSLLILMFCTSTLFANILYIDKSSFTNSKLLNYTIADASDLLKQSKVSVADKETSVNWKIVLVLEQNKMAYKTLYDANTKATQQFSIQSSKENNVSTIVVTSQSEKGLSNGIYYFLQNKLGFQFYHPKETSIPDLSNYVLDTFTETITPRFDKIGFHIHAMHPLEITEALLNENTPNGAEEIKAYIDWLSRNGQNYFEFNLLRSIKLKTWIPYIKPIVDYAHERGIICGADMSFHMIQQRAFQLYKKFPASFRKKDKQILDNITQLMQVNWDVWNVEFATTEFTHKNQDKLHEQQKFLFDNLSKYKVKLTSRKHVVKDENLISNAKSVKTKRTDMDSAYALFVHTVMFYGLQDSSTPVYRNKDFSHLRNLLIESKEYRDTWYFPESAYWITFDNSVPMFLTPYLDARMKDILYCDSLGIDGHLTFSSGWEWNYWLIDWSIARWCWNDTKKAEPLQFLKEVVKDTSFIDFVTKANDLQTDFIKDKQLIKVLTAQTITDEIGGKLNLEFHPRPEYSYKYIMNKATKEELDFIQKKYVDMLDAYVKVYNYLKSTSNILPKNKIEKEILLSLDITALRAEHRKNTLSYLIAYRLSKLNKTKNPVQQYLDAAKSVRENALVMVKQQEQNYRYPVASLAAEKKSKTVYNFGYLYPVSNLHFWEREELQAKNNKWKFYYQNIWDVLKIIGVKK
ncbi:MAG: hypothetical protein IPP60_05565 [Sphingobacteriales bacterium]|nr:hypothetical protein [Sphingobacteriales bacterium]